MSLGSCNYMSHLGYTNHVASHVVIHILILFHASRVLHLHSSLLLMILEKKHNIFVSIYIFISMRLSVYEDTVVTLLFSNTIGGLPSYGSTPLVDLLNSSAARLVNLELICVDLIRNITI